MAENRIIDTIINDAVKNSDDIINQSRKQAVVKIDEAKKNIEKQRVKLNMQFENEAKAITEAATPAAQTAVKNAILKTKREEIDKTIDMIFEKIEILPDEYYFKIIKLLLKNNNQSKKGQIMFNKKDIKRLPDGFLDEFENLSLAKKAVDISGGFVLKFSKVYIDCAFESIRLEKYDDLVDLLNRELFKA